MFKTSVKWQLCSYMYDCMFNIYIYMCVCLYNMGFVISYMHIYMMIEKSEHLCSYITSYIYRYMCIYMYRYILVYHTFVHIVYWDNIWMKMVFIVINSVAIFICLILVWVSRCNEWCCRQHSISSSSNSINAIINVAMYCIFLS